MPDSPIPENHDRWKDMSLLEALHDLMKNAPTEAWVNYVYEEEIDWV